MSDAQRSCRNPFGKLYRNLPAGDYRVSVVETSGRTATYKFGLRRS